MSKNQTNPESPDPIAKKTGNESEKLPTDAKKDVNNDAGSNPAPTSDSEDRLRRPDPTRYGDWEKNGRCIDF